MKSMKLFVGLLLSVAVVGISCWASEEGEKIVDSGKYEFSLRNYTPSIPIYGMTVKEENQESVKMFKLDRKNPVIKSTFSRQFGLMVTTIECETVEEFKKRSKELVEELAKKVGQEEANKILTKKIVGYGFADKEVKLAVAKKLNLKKRNRETKAIEYDTMLRLEGKTFHLGAKVKTVKGEKEIEVFPAVKTPEFKNIPTNNIKNAELGVWAAPITEEE